MNGGDDDVPVRMQAGMRRSRRPAIDAAPVAAMTCRSHTWHNSPEVTGKRWSGTMAAAGEREEEGDESGVE